MAKADDQRQITIRIDPELYDRVAEIAAEQERSMNSQIGKLLEAAANRLRNPKGRPAGLGEDRGGYAKSLSGKAVPAEDLELSFLRDALWIVEEGAKQGGLTLTVDEKAEWVILVYRIKRMMPTFEPSDLAARIQEEMMMRAEKGEGDKPKTPGSGTW
jgi:hypothetical protein